MAGHGAGESFVLLDSRTLKPVELPVELMGSTVTVTAHGRGDIASPPFTSRIANGEAMRPLSPAHLRAWFALDGTLTINWVQRSRLAWSWVDEVAAAPDPSVQGYRLRLGGTSSTIERDCSEAQAMLSASDVALLGAGPIALQVHQIGPTALSRPATLTINA